MNMNWTRPPPPQGAPPSYAFVSRVYRRSLRPVVISIGMLSALWSLLWGISAFRDINIDQQHATRLKVFDIVLGSLYIATCCIELLGVAGAWMQKLAIVRIYSFLALGAAILVAASGLIRVVMHFMFKNDLINECIALATGERVIERFGLWGPTSETTLTKDEATRFCNRAWSHDSFSEIAWLLVATILGLLFASIAFAYYRQLLDPTSPANAARAPSNQIRREFGMGGVPAHYAPPYNGGADQFGSMPHLGYGAPVGGGGAFAPPPGPPPGDRDVPAYEPGKLPGYGAGAGAGYGAGEDDKKDDPFADFDGPNRERDRDRV